MDYKHWHMRSEPGDISGFTFWKAAVNSVQVKSSDQELEEFGRNLYIFGSRHPFVFDTKSILTDFAHIKIIAAD